ncbi:MAG: hypothetical protein WBA93_23570 [Microcoleaceae cyanobacterium]
MINDPYTFLNAVLQGESEITSLLGVYQGTDIPLIKRGILAEVETDLPAITITSPSGDLEDGKEDCLMTINCYAKTEDESYKVARKVLHKTNKHQYTKGQYSATMTGQIFPSVPDPNANEVNTPLEIRVFKIGGAV